MRGSEYEWAWMWVDWRGTSESECEWVGVWVWAWKSLNKNNLSASECVGEPTKRKNEESGEDLQLRSRAVTPSRQLIMNLKPVGTSRPKNAKAHAEKQNKLGSDPTAPKNEYQARFKDFMSTTSSVKRVRSFSQTRDKEAEEHYKSCKTRNDFLDYFSWRGLSAFNAWPLMMRVDTSARPPPIRHSQSLPGSRSLVSPNWRLFWSIRFISREILGSAFSLLFSSQ